MSSTNTGVPAREQNIRTHAALAVLSIKTGSLHSLQAFESARVTISFLGAVGVPLPDDIKAKIVGINLTSVKTVQDDT